MQNENVNFEFLVDQLREVTAERNNLRGLVDDVSQLRLRIDILTCFKKKAFEILKKRSDIIESLKRALEVQAENFRQQQIPNPDYVDVEKERLQRRISMLSSSNLRAREIGTTWRRRCQDLYSTIERVRLENERLKLQIERMQKKESFIKAMES